MAVAAVQRYPTAAGLSYGELKHEWDEPLPFDATACYLMRRELARSDARVAWLRWRQWLRSTKAEFRAMTLATSRARVRASALALTRWWDRVVLWSLMRHTADVSAAHSLGRRALCGWASHARSWRHAYALMARTRRRARAAMKAFGLRRAIRRWRDAFCACDERRATRQRLRSLFLGSSWRRLLEHAAR